MPEAEVKPGWQGLTKSQVWNSPLMVYPYAVRALPRTHLVPPHDEFSKQRLDEFILLSTRRAAANGVPANQWVSTVIIQQIKQNSEKPRKCGQSEWLPTFPQTPILSGIANDQWGGVVQASYSVSYGSWTIMCGMPSDFQQPDTTTKSTEHTSTSRLPESASFPATQHPWTKEKKRNRSMADSDTTQQPSSSRSRHERASPMLLSKPEPVVEAATQPKSDVEATAQPESVAEAAAQPSSLIEGMNIDGPYASEEMDESGEGSDEEDIDMDAEAAVPWTFLFRTGKEVKFDGSNN